MPQVFVPGGSYRLHSNPVDMARMRVANGFGLRGLMGDGDPRNIPARGPSVVLPLVRGRDGWFYLSDGRRAQDRGPGMGRLGDAAADYLAQANQVTPGSVQWQFLMGCSQNPTAPQCAAGVSAALNNMAVYSTAVPVPAQPVLTPTQAQLSAATGKPNQSVPPTDNSTPLPTGTGASGGNPVLSGNNDAGGNPPPSSNAELLILGLGLAALFLMRGK